MNVLLLFADSGIPPISVMLFIVGAFLFIVSALWGAFREPLSWERGSGIGLMIFAIGLRVMFGV